MMRQKLRRGLCILLAGIHILAITAYAKPDWPADVGIQAEAGIVMDLDSDTVILGQNSHVGYPPASITKLMTALIVLEHANLSDVVTYSETAMNSVERDSGNKLNLTAGDTMTVEDCLYALLLTSVNQAANALAEYVAGSIPAFVEMMNARLDELGLTESHFDNPSGLNGDTQYVSAHDMAKIAQAAYNNEELLKISSSVSYTIGATQNNPEGKTIQNEHRLVITEDPSSSYYFPEAVAGKTGYLIAAGNTLVTYAEKDGRRLVSVILKGKPRQYFLDGKALLQFGFDRFYNMDIAENETRYVTGSEPVTVGGITYSPEDLMIEPDRVITIPDSAVFSDSEVTLAEIPENAPAGAIGLLQYTYNERAIGSAYLFVRSEYEGAQAPQPEQPTTEGLPSGPEDESPESIPEPAPAEKEDTGFSLWVIVVPVGILLILIAVLFAYLLIRRKKEAEEAARRREKRRQRLMSEGSQEEFDRLLEQKRSRGRRK